ncbi:MAG: noncanonical pyrimidine nucleotidase, YjjG family protein [Saprospiraceae bacterium]|nr:MAG: noncanonical pyrimidine nucleotidase, YjjG family protein [Saprospiraceae bacterium]
MSEPRYSWLLLDADDTLFDFRLAARAALQKTLTWAGLPFSEEARSIFERINLEVWESFERNEISVDRLRLERFERFLDVIGEFRNPAEMSRYYLTVLSQHAFLLPGAETFLEELRRRGVELVLVTNGLSEVQRPRIATSRLDRYFRHIVVSDEIGVSKPDAAFFEMTFEKMGQPSRSKVLMVGDSLSSDVGGGNGFGLHTCWFNPEGRQNLSVHNPTYEVRSYEEIMRIVEGGA